MINVLALLKSMEWRTNYWMELAEVECHTCGKDYPNHGSTCELKAAIDALECGKIQVIHTPNYTSEFIATIEGINENIKRKAKEQGK